MKKFLYKSVISLLCGLFVLVLFSSIIFMPAVGEAQAPYASDWKSMVNRDFVNDVAVHRGNVWQGINGGLVARSLYGPTATRYYHKLNSGLQAAQVLSVAVDARGNVWAGTERGAFLRNIHGEWSTINMDNSPFTVNTVRVVAPDDEGGIWFGTWLGGAYYRDSGNEWTVYNSQNSGIAGNRITAIVPDGAGGVWFGTDSRGVAYLDEGGEWTVYNAANSLLPANDVQDILIDAKGGVWFATMSGLTYLDQVGNNEAEAAEENGEVEWTIYNLQNSQIPSEIVNSLALDEDGNLWMGTNGGLACLEIANGGTWKVYTTANSSLPVPVVRGIGIDMWGTVWAGTWGGGMAGFNPKDLSWRVYGHEMVSLTGRSYLPSNTVNKILPFPEGSSAGKVWFATGAGVASYDGEAEKWEILKADNKLPVSQVNSLARDRQGNVAFATDGGGLAVMSAAGTWQNYNEENSDIPSDGLADVTYDSGGGIWVVTTGGRAAYRDASGEWTVYAPGSDGLPVGDYRLNSVYQDGTGNVWFGSWGGGAIRLDNAGNWTAYKAGGSGMPANDVSRVVGDAAGNMWFGTWGGGAVRLDSAGNWNVFNMDNSDLPSDIIRDLTIDSRGWIWAATPQGVIYYDGTNWNIIRARTSGLPVNSVWNLAVDTNGNVWFATNENGVAIYNPDGVTAALARFTDITETRDSIIIYDGKYLESDVSPVIEDSRLLLPMRPLATALGAVLHWDEAARKVEMILGDKEVVLHIDDTNAHINDELYTLDVPARIRGNRTMIPVRFVSESLGLDVTWDSVVRAALLTK